MDVRAKKYIIPWINIFQRKSQRCHQQASNITGDKSNATPGNKVSSALSDKIHILVK
jgi:hypothetical protein